MDQIMEEARLCQEKLEELKMAAVQVSAITTILFLTIMTRNDVVACQAQRVGDIPRLQGLSQQLELCNAKQQDLLRERDDHQRLLRFAFITSLLRRKKRSMSCFFGTCSIFIVLWSLFF